MSVKLISNVFSFPYISLGLYIAVLITVCSQGTSHEYTTRPFSKQISSNLELFFEQTMRGCTIRTVFDGRRGYSEQVFMTLTSHQNSLKTFVGDKYQVFKKSRLLSEKSGLTVVVSNNESDPQWLLKKFTLCYIHLYIAEEDNDFQTIIRHHFVDFDLRKENPDYVIIWDLNESQSRYRSWFLQQEFHRSFMDYRLVIRRDLSSRLFDVSLVCIVCPWRFPEGTISPAVTPPTSSNIHRTWKNVHTNHFGMDLSCLACREIYQPPKQTLKYMPSFQLWIAELTNTTLYVGVDLIFNSPGEMAYTVGLTPTSAQYLFTKSRHPQYTMSPSFHTAYVNNMFTVVHKNLLLAAGLQEFAAPFTKLAWCCFVLSLLCIFMLSRSVAIQLRNSSLLLSIFGPLTDHWTQHFNPSLQRMFLLWGILCYSITILYGGELASSFAVLKPPEYPICMMDLLDMSTTVKSLTNIWTGYVYNPKLAHDLESIKLLWTEKRTGDANINGNTLDRLQSVINEVNRGYCGTGDQKFNRSNQESPILCWKTPYLSNPDKPITFVGSRYLFQLERYMFQDSSVYWVSSTSRVPELQDQNPLIVSRNYLAKLVLPIASYWAASGLNKVWEQIWETSFEAWLYKEKQTAFNADMNAESTRVIDFTPATLRTTLPVIILSGILLGVALTVLVWEWLEGNCTVFCVSIDKLTKLGPTFNGLRKNQTTGFPEDRNVPVANSKRLNFDDAIQHKHISPKVTCRNDVVQIKVLPKSNINDDGTASCENNHCPQFEFSAKTVEGALKRQRRLRLQDAAQSIRQRLRRQFL